METGLLDSVIGLFGDIWTFVQTVPLLVAAVGMPVAYAGARYIIRLIKTSGK